MYDLNHAGQPFKLSENTSIPRNCIYFNINHNIKLISTYININSYWFKFTIASKCYTTWLLILYYTHTHTNTHTHTTHTQTQTNTEIRTHTHTHMHSLMANSHICVWIFLQGIKPPPLSHLQITQIDSNYSSLPITYPLLVCWTATECLTTPRWK